MFKKLPVL